LPAIIDEDAPCYFVKISAAITIGLRLAREKVQQAACRAIDDGACDLVANLRLSPDELKLRGQD
jgi:hypothetical protein